MKRLAVPLLLILIYLGIGATQVAQAGGASPYTTLSFPGSNSQSCGHWQVSGYSGMNRGFIAYYLTDGDGSLLSVGVVSPRQHVLTGSFFVRPKQNPIHFVATAYDRGIAYNVGNLYSNNPCLFTPTFVPSPVPSLSFTPVPSLTPMSTLPPTFEPVSTLIPPQVSIYCDKTVVHGMVNQTLAPYVRATVSLGSNLMVTLATSTVTPSGSNYDIVLTYPVQPTGTHLIVAVGQWDGTKYISPANLSGGDCVNATSPTNTPTVVPTSTAPAPNYHIEYFTAEPTTISAGGCVVLSYWAVGAKQILLKPSNSSNSIVINDNPNQRTICPSAADHYMPGQPVVYTLVVTYLDNTTETRAVTVNVLSEPTPTPPPSSTFEPSPIPTHETATPITPDATPTPIQ